AAPSARTTTRRPPRRPGTTAPPAATSRRTPASTTSAISRARSATSRRPACSIIRTTPATPMSATTSATTWVAMPATAATSAAAIWPDAPASAVDRLAADGPQEQHVPRLRHAALRRRLGIDEAGRATPVEHIQIAHEILRQLQRSRHAQAHPFRDIGDEAVAVVEGQVPERPIPAQLANLGRQRAIPERADLTPVHQVAAPRVARLELDKRRGRQHGKQRRVLKDSAWIKPGITRTQQAAACVGAAVSDISMPEDAAGARAEFDGVTLVCTRRRHGRRG